MLFVWFCASSFPYSLPHSWSSLVLSYRPHRLPIFNDFIVSMSSSIWMTCSECYMLRCSVMLPVSIHIASSMSSFPSIKFIKCSFHLLIICLWFVSMFLFQMVFLLFFSFPHFLPGSKKIVFDCSSYFSPFSPNSVRSFLLGVINLFFRPTTKSFRLSLTSDFLLICTTFPWVLLVFFSLLWSYPLRYLF